MRRKWRYCSGLPGYGRFDHWVRWPWGAFRQLQACLRIPRQQVDAALPGAGLRPTARAKWLAGTLPKALAWPYAPMVGLCPANCWKVEGSGAWKRARGFEGLCLSPGRPKAGNHASTRG